MHFKCNIPCYISHTSKATSTVCVWGGGGGRGVHNFFWSFFLGGLNFGGENIFVSLFFGILPTLSPVIIITPPPPSPWFRGSHLNSSPLLISLRRVIILPCHVSIEMRGSFAPCMQYLLFFLIVSQTWNHKIIADRFTLGFILVTLCKRKT